jgi:hypothetical protein
MLQKKLQNILASLCNKVYNMHDTYNIVADWKQTFITSTDRFRVEKHNMEKT